MVKFEIEDKVRIKDNYPCDDTLFSSRDNEMRGQTGTITTLNVGFEFINVLMDSGPMAGKKALFYPEELEHV
jgi:hypothetical protein